ncbi:MAG: hypothetical protein N3F07_02040 [Candidatus Micrarchaeota archaeon]|nr:hypothetical protein [Candidatus Micrarchaeota archaeon]
MPSLKAPAKLAIIDCNTDKKKTGVYTRLPIEVYKNRAEKHSKERRIDFSVFKPETEKRMPDLKSFDAFIISDSSYTPTQEFMEKEELGKMLPEFISKLVDSGKPSLCICFGMEAVAATFGVYPVSNEEHGTGRIFHFGYSTILLEMNARKDWLFSDYKDRTKAIFAHRYILLQAPEGSEVLAKTYMLPVAAFRKGNAYCVQWQPDLDLKHLLESAEEHKKSDLMPSYGYEPSLNPFSIISRYKPEHDEQNAQALDLFFRKLTQ